MTATLDRPRVASPVTIDSTAECREIALGLPAAMLVSSWMFVFDRHLALYDVWASIAAALAFLALARPIARRGMLRRGWLAAVQLGTLLLIVLTADRADRLGRAEPAVRCRLIHRLGRAQPRRLSHGC